MFLAINDESFFREPFDGRFLDADSRDVGAIECLVEICAYTDPLGSKIDVARRHDLGRCRVFDNVRNLCAQKTGNFVIQFMIGQNIDERARHRRPTKLPSLLKNFAPLILAVFVTLAKSRCKHLFIHEDIT